MASKETTLLPIADKAAIGLSLVCAVHCLAVPLLVVLAPSLVGQIFTGEAFHQWIVIVVIPVSVYALTLGCKKHHDKSVLAIGILGLALLCLAAIGGHDWFGEFGERAVTLIGAGIIAFSHVRNFSLCRKGESCGCPEAG